MVFAKPQWFRLSKRSENTLVPVKAAGWLFMLTGGLLTGIPTILLFSQDKFPQGFVWLFVSSLFFLYELTSVLKELRRNKVLVIDEEKAEMAYHIEPEPQKGTKEDGEVLYINEETVAKPPTYTQSGKHSKDKTGQHEEIQYQHSVYRRRD